MIIFLRMLSRFIILYYVCNTIQLYLMRKILLFLFVLASQMCFADRNDFHDLIQRSADIMVKEGGNLPKTFPNIIKNSIFAL